MASVSEPDPGGRGLGYWIAMVAPFLALFFLSSPVLADDWHPIENMTGYESVLDIQGGANWTLYSAGTGVSDPVREWRIDQRTQQQVPNSTSQQSVALAFSDEDLLAYATWNGGAGREIVVVDTLSWTTVMRYGGLNRSVASLAWLNETTLLVGDDGGGVYLLGIDGVRGLTYAETGEAVQFVVASRAPAYVAAGTRFGQVDIWAQGAGPPLFSYRDVNAMFVDGEFIENLGVFVFIDSTGFLRWVSLTSWSVSFSIPIIENALTLGHLPASNDLLLGLRNSPFLAAVSGLNGSSLWNNSVLYGPVEKIAAARGGAWFATSASGSISIWATRDDPWKPPAAPIPVVSFASPANGSTLEGVVDFGGVAVPAGSATAVLFGIDGAPPAVATGVDSWHVMMDLTYLESGYHVARAWGLGDQIVGPSAELGFFVLNNGSGGARELQVRAVFPTNGSTVYGDFTAAGRIFNASQSVAIFARIGNAPWVVAQVAGDSWMVDLTPRNQSGNGTIEVAAYDIAGRYATAIVNVFFESQQPLDSPPRVTLQSPLNGTEVVGEIQFVGHSEDDRAVAFTQIWIENTTHAWLELESSWSFSANISDLSGGWHVVWVEAQDDTGQRTVVGARVLVQIAPRIPRLSILAPADGSMLLFNRPLALVGTCLDCPPDATLRVRVNGQLVGEAQPANTWTFGLEPRFFSEGHSRIEVVLVLNETDLTRTSIGVESTKALTATGSEPLYIMGIIVAAAVAVFSLLVARRAIR